MWQVFLALFLVSIALAYNISQRSSTNYQPPAPVSKFKTLYQWNKITIDSLEGSSNLNVSHGVPFDFDKSIDGRIFISLVPKNKNLISLTTISGNQSKEGPLLTPYPDSTWFLNPRNCSNITVAGSIKIDKCNRLWVLDTGNYKGIQVCKPKLLAFSLINNELFMKYEIPEEIYTTKPKNNILINPVVEIEDYSCKIKSVYMADSQGYGIVKWNGRRFRQLGGVEFPPENASKYFNTSSTTLFFPGGKVPLVLNPNSHTLSQALLTSSNLSTSEKNGLKKTPDKNSKLHGQIELLNSQPPFPFRFSTNGKILFMGLVNNSIQCWRVGKKFDAQNIDTAIVDIEGTQFAISIKIYPKKKQEDDRIWILMYRAQKTMTENRNFDEVNFKILKVSMKELIKDTHCI